MSRRRLFHTEQQPGGITERWYSDEEGNVTRDVTQDATGVIEAVQGMTEHARGKSMYYLGSIPLILAQQWARECGHAIGTKEFAEFAKKRLMDRDFARLSTGIRV